MALQPLAIQPGIYTETTPRAALNRWRDGNNVRFFKGNPEKVGGRAKLLSSSFYGKCRAMTSWQTLTFSRYIGMGTSQKLYLNDTVAFYDITPLSSSGTLGTDPLTTTNGSPTIVVAHTAHGRNVDDWIHLTGATAVGGVTPNGDFTVGAVIDADTYSFDFTSAATSDDTGGGAAVDYEYEIPVGNDDAIPAAGWGTGGWGVGTWGISAGPGTLQDSRVWSLAPWGENLLACPGAAPLYVWSASGGTTTRATLISAAPAQSRRVLVSDQLRIAISYGSHDGSNPDPMLIRWSDSEDYTQWTPDITNLSGDIRLGQGTRIIAAVPTRAEIAVITDTTVYAQTETGDDLVFSFVAKGQTCGLMGPNAAADVDGVLYCMGLTNFYTYDGQVVHLPCDLHSMIFGTPESPGINMVQASKVWCSWNRRKNEVIWFYCDSGSSEINRCIGMNLTDKSWWRGSVACTAWLDQHPFTESFTTPISAAVGPDGLCYLYTQETGVDDDGAALPYFLESYDVEIGATSNMITGTVTGAGEDTHRVTRIFPDLIRCIGNHYLSLKGRKTPTSRQWVKGPKKFNATKTHVDMHIRQRQIAFRIESSEIGADISLGNWRFDDEIESEK